MEDAMNKKVTANEATYAPQYYKTFSGALEAFLCEECPQLGGFRTRQVLANSIHNMVLKFFPETSHLRQGQTPWTTVHKDEKMSYGKSVKKTRLTNVILELVQEDDSLERAAGKKLKDIKKEAVARLHKQAYDQDGCLTNAETAVLLKISSNTVSKYIKEWENENNEVIPRRGTIHDIGPSLTHKKIIIEKLFIEKKTVQQVSRETYHSLQAIQRYISTFKQVLLCKKKNFTVDEVAYAIGKSTRLTKEYFNIIEEYKERGYVIENIEKYEVQNESNFEKDINYMKEEQGQVSV